MQGFNNNIRFASRAPALSPWHGAHAAPRLLLRAPRPPSSHGPHVRAALDPRATPLPIARRWHLSWSVPTDALLPGRHRGSLKRMSVPTFALSLYFFMFWGLAAISLTAAMTCCMLGGAGAHEQPCDTLTQRSHWAADSTCGSPGSPRPCTRTTSLRRVLVPTSRVHFCFYCLCVYCMARHF
jgi:hypothetical protein